MPNIKSSIKRVRLTKKRTQINKMRKSALKTSIKKAVQLIESGDVDNAKQAFVNAVKSIDKAVAKGILHKNTAARKKSNLQKKLNKLIAQSAN